MHRSRTYTVAAVLHLLISAYGIVGAFPYIARGIDNINQSADAPPYLVIILGFVASVVGMVSAYGVWRSYRWGVILTIMLRTVDGIAALPGVLFAPTTFLWVASIVNVVVSATIIILLLWRGPTLAAA